MPKRLVGCWQATHLLHCFQHIFTLLHIHTFTLSHLHSFTHSLFHDVTLSLSLSKSMPNRLVSYWQPTHLLHCFQHTFTLRTFKLLHILSLCQTFTFTKLMPKKLVGFWQVASVNPTFPLHCFQHTFAPSLFYAYGSVSAGRGK